MKQGDHSAKTSQGKKEKVGNWQVAALSSTMTSRHRQIREKGGGGDMHRGRKKRRVVVNLWIRKKTKRREGGKA